MPAWKNLRVADSTGSRGRVLLIVGAVAIFVVGAVIAVLGTRAASSARDDRDAAANALAAQEDETGEVEGNSAFREGNLSSQRQARKDLVVAGEPWLETANTVATEQERLAQIIQEQIQAGLNGQVDQYNALIDDGNAAAQSLQSLSPTLQAQFEDVAFAPRAVAQRRALGCRGAMNEQRGMRLMLVFGLVLAIAVGTALVVVFAS